MKSMIFTGVAALAFVAVPAAADHHMEGEQTSFERNEEQSALYNGWPAERRASYDAWPAGIQEYYWTLEPAQADGWWVLTDPQRVRVYEMTPDQRAKAWQQINAQMSASTTGEAAQAAASSANTQAPRFVRSEVTQTTPAGYKSAEGEELPVCSDGQQDGCINSWEKNRTGTRPLEYWPGRPASEIDAPLPATQAEFESMSKAENDEPDAE